MLHYTNKFITGFNIAQKQPSTSYSHNEKYSQENKQSKILEEAVITLRLGALVAHFNAENSHDAADIRHRLKNSIEHHLIFSATEKVGLNDYLHRRLAALENIVEVKAELARLVLNKKRRVRHILLTIAFADNHISPPKRQHIERLYLALGLDKLMLKDDINTFFVKKITPKNDKTTLSPVCDPLKLHTFNPPSLPKTDSDYTAIFSADKDTPKKRSEAVTATYGQKSLAEKREALYHHLIRKQWWPHNEFNRWCKYYKLTHHGAIEIINKWADQQIGQAVLSKEKEGISIHTNIVTKIQQSTVRLSNTY